MRTLRTAVSRAVDIVFRRGRDARLEEEMQHHLERLAAEHEQRGLSRAAAARAARRSFGGIDQVRFDYRAQRGWPTLDRWLQDLRSAGRSLARDAGFTFAVTALLTLGIGVSHLFFTLTYAYTVRGLPMADVHRVIDISTIDRQDGPGGVSYPDFLDLRAAQSSFDGLAAFTNVPVVLGGPDTAPERIDATYTTSAAFALAKVVPLVGRVFAPDDDIDGATPVVVIAERLWQSRFAGATDIVGRPATINGVPSTVVGVVADASGFPSAAAAWMPLSTWSGFGSLGRDSRALRVFGRLTATATPAQAETDVVTTFDRLTREYPDINRDRRLSVVPLNERFVASRAGWAPFMLAGAIVIAVAALNVGNLLAVRATRRGREFAVRASLGATPYRLARQLLVEAGVVTLLGATFGFIVSRLAAGWFQRGIPDGSLPYWSRFGTDAVVMWGVAGLALLPFAAAVAVGVRAANTATPFNTLKETGRSASPRGSRRIFSTISLGLQIALAAVLMTNVGLAALDARLDRLPTDGQLDDPGVLTASYPLAAPAYATAAEKNAFNERVLTDLRTVPGVTTVALASHLPLGGAFARRLRVEGQSVPASGGLPVPVVAVTPDYFELLGLRPTRGRPFATPDIAARFPVLVNERFVSQFLPDGAAVGTRIALDEPTHASEDWSEIVGIVRDVRQNTAAYAQPVVYVPLALAPPATVHLLARAPASAMATLRARFRALDPTLPLDQTQTLASARWNAQWLGRMSNRLARTVTLASMLLAIAGLSAVVAHRAALRKREIGVRMALGATPRQIVLLVTRSVTPAIGIGLLLGLLGVFGWTRGFAPAQPSTAAAVTQLALATTGSLLLIAVCACALPARRAAGLEPADTLRPDS